ncbi:retrovirus-related pol polyprotein from transposon TNT 1-94 [Tanacetum coccineum]|uniref:Retrovirus-related pol polyprotein from transposon TNT 1-94 n=1 Tax=Tanacetum coccineum TaxID=301880 RepID=A0ABQ4Z3D0_9ASTR
MGKKNGKSIQNGPTPHPMITDPPPTDSAAVPAPRKKLDSEFSLPRHIFNNLNQTSTAKEIWDNVEMLMQGSGRTIQQRKEDLFDEYERFRAIGNESIHDYFVRFHKLVNDMKITQLNIPTHQMNTKFVNNLPAYWGKYVTNVKQNMDISTTPYVQIYTHLKAYEPHAKKTLKKQEQSTSIVDPLAYVAHTTSAPALSSPSTPSPQPTAQSPNDALMATMTQIANLLSGFQKQFPPTNNQLRTSSNSRTHATVHDGHIVTEPVQRKAPGNNGNTGTRGKKVICYNCRGEGHVARQCKEPKRKMDSQYFKDKALLMEAKEKGDVLDAEAEAFLADVECTAPYDQPQALTTTNMFQANHEDAYDSDVDEGPNAAVAFMANLSSTSATNNPVNEKPKRATKDLHKDILGTRNPGLGYMAKRAQPVLYDADTLLHPNHHPVSIWDSEDVLVHQVVSMKKMNEKPGHVRPANGFYDKLNALMFVPQKDLSGDQAYWLSATNIASQASKSATPATPFVRKSRPPSQVLASLRNVNAVFPQFEETDRIQLKDTITSLRIQLDGLKVENVSLKRRYDELSKANTHSRTAYTEKLSAFTAENTKLKAQVTGTTSSGPSTSETPKVLAPGMYNLGSNKCSMVFGLWMRCTYAPVNRARLINFVEKVIGKSKKASHPLKTENTNTEVLHTYILDSDEPMRTEVSTEHETYLQYFECLDLCAPTMNDDVFRPRTSTNELFCAKQYRLETYCLRQDEQFCTSKRPEPPSVPLQRNGRRFVSKWFDDDELFDSSLSDNRLHVPACPHPEICQCSPSTTVISERRS